MEEHSFTIQNANGENLSALVNEGYSEKCIIMVHGFGGTKDFLPFQKAAYAFAEKGYSVIRFDCRGSGQSDGTFEKMTLSSEVEDLKTVFSYAQKQYDSIALVGLSMGALIVLMAQLPACAQILWAPALRLKRSFEERYFKGKWDTVLTQDATMLKSRSGRGEFIVGRAFLEEIYTLDSKTLIRETTVPTLLIHGTQDTVIPHKHSVELFEQFSCRRELVLLHTNHDFTTNLDRAVSETLHWCNEWCVGDEV